MLEHPPQGTLLTIDLDSNIPIQAKKHFDCSKGRKK
jgi:hypothetical protein